MMSPTAKSRRSESHDFSAGRAGAWATAGAAGAALGAAYVHGDGDAAPRRRGVRGDALEADLDPRVAPHDGDRLAGLDDVRRRDRRVAQHLAGRDDAPGHGPDEGGAQ